MEVNTALLQGVLSTEEVSQGTDSQEKNASFPLIFNGWTEKHTEKSSAGTLTGRVVNHFCWFRHIHHGLNREPLSYKHQIWSRLEMSTRLLWLMLALVVVYILVLHLDFSVLPQPTAFCAVTVSC